MQLLSVLREDTIKYINIIHTIYIIYLCIKLCTCTIAIQVSNPCIISPVYKLVATVRQ